jgi:putative Mg2+ transporter-C (MgtC) family protein
VSLHPGIADIGLRLLLTLLAGALIGFDRSEHGHAAGLRTTTLLCLAASVAMIQANLLLPTSGKESGSFSAIDVMRLPLGILSGIGFIGAGAIVRKDDMVSGVTTAATLWLATVVGLCFGGGQLWLGAVATALAWAVLRLLKSLDAKIPHDRSALLTIGMPLGVAIEPALGQILSGAGIRATFVNGCYDRETGMSKLAYEIRWRAAFGEEEPAQIVGSLLDLSGVRVVHWNGRA